MFQRSWMLCEALSALMKLSFRTEERLWGDDVDVVGLEHNGTEKKNWSTQNGDASVRVCVWESEETWICAWRWKLEKGFLEMFFDRIVEPKTDTFSNSQIRCNEWSNGSVSSNHFYLEKSLKIETRGKQHPNVKIKKQNVMIFFPINFWPLLNRVSFWGI